MTKVAKIVQAVYVQTSQFGKNDFFNVIKILYLTLYNSQEQLYFKAISSYPRRALYGRLLKISYQPRENSS